MVETPLKNRGLAAGRQRVTRFFRRSVPTAVTVIAAVAIFFLGVGIGDGRISAGRGAFNKPVAGELPATLDYASVSKVYDALKKDYDGQLTEAQLLDGLKEGLASATGDPYTEFFNAKDATAFNQQLNNSFSGIGAELGEDSDGNLQIISPIKGYPAAKAGLQPKDIIVAIDGKSTSGMSVGTAVTAIRGQSGTKVTLKIIRDKTHNLSITITRADITLPSVTSKIIDGDIGYMQISTYANDTSGLAQKAANMFVQHHVKGVILDVRDNPGGLLDAAVNVSSLWLPGGQTILQEKRGGVTVNTYKATGNDVLHGLPTVVLINDGSASASEITAGALHDNGAARLIGVKSYGKGSVQQIEQFPDGGELKVTVARWYRPDGQNIDKKGITPDQTVELSQADIKAKNDVQQAAAIRYLQSQAH